VGTTEPTAPTGTSLHRLGDAAERLGFTYRHVRRLIASGQLAAVNIGNTKRGPSWRVSEEALRAFQTRRARP
jgi:excisionase family DNA binding protein